MGSGVAGVLLSHVFPFSRNPKENQIFTFIWNCGSRSTRNYGLWQVNESAGKWKEYSFLQLFHVQTKTGSLETTEDECPWVLLFLSSWKQSHHSIHTPYFPFYQQLRPTPNDLVQAGKRGTIEHPSSYRYLIFPVQNNTCGLVVRFREVEETGLTSPENRTHPSFQQQERLNWPFPTTTWLELTSQPPNICIYMRWFRRTRRSGVIPIAAWDIPTKTMDRLSLGADLNTKFRRSKPFLSSVRLLLAWSSDVMSNT
jgi:hypothetical protein